MPSLMRKSDWWGCSSATGRTFQLAVLVASRSVSVLVELSRRGRARVPVRVGDGGPRRWRVLVLDNGGGKSSGG